jgi:hypothetical protein
VLNLYQLGNNSLIGNDIDGQPGWIVVFIDPGWAISQLKRMQIKPDVLPGKEVGLSEYRKGFLQQL